MIEVFVLLLPCYQILTDNSTLEWWMLHKPIDNNDDWIIIFTKKIFPHLFSRIHSYILVHLLIWTYCSYSIILYLQTCWFEFRTGEGVPLGQQRLIFAWHRWTIRYRTTTCRRSATTTRMRSSSACWSSCRPQRARPSPWMWRRWTPSSASSPWFRTRGASLSPSSTWSLRATA